VLVTTNGGKTWLPFDDGLPKVPVYALVHQRAAGALVAGTFGRSAWIRTFAAGSLSATPTRLDFSAQAGGAAPAAQAIAVINTDVYGSTVHFTVAAGAPWLAVDTASGDAAGATPVTVHASVDPSRAGAGGHDAAVTIRPEGGAAITIPVHLTLTAPPPGPVAKGCGCRVAGEAEVGRSGARSWLGAMVAALACLRRARPPSPGRAPWALRRAVSRRRSSFPPPTPPRPSAACYAARG
jgi:hypothetical protein